MRTFTKVLLLTAAAALISSCKSPQPTTPPPSVDAMIAVHTLIDAPDDFAAQHIGTPEFPLPPYSKFLQGVKICLDPGHGGDAEKRGYKRGPTGVREAEVNLRVAKYLRELLTRCGAEVKLTREDDVDSSLEARANIANTWGADLFLALHHNAIDNKPQVNHTTVWYHKDVDYRPSDLDLARYICQGLYDSLALPEITDVPLKSDQLMYESGFGVLRAAQVTAALSETSFFTNPDEEQRLRTPEYNLREAYGHFLGLARYAAAGLPRAKLVDPADGIVVPPTETDEQPDEDNGGQTAQVGGAVFRLVATDGAAPWLMQMAPPSDNGSAEDDKSDDADFIPIVFELDDGLRGRKSWGWQRQMILSDTIAARVDGADVPVDFENEGYRLTVGLPSDIKPGQHDVEVQFQNMNKNSVLNPHFTITVK